MDAMKEDDLPVIASIIWSKQGVLWLSTLSSYLTSVEQAKIDGLISSWRYRHIGKHSQAHKPASTTTTKERRRDDGDSERWK